MFNDILPNHLLQMLNGIGREQFIA